MIACIAGQGAGSGPVQVLSVLGQLPPARLSGGSSQKVSNCLLEWSCTSAWQNNLLYLMSDLLDLCTCRVDEVLGTIACVDGTCFAKG